MVYYDADTLFYYYSGQTITLSAGTVVDIGNVGDPEEDAYEASPSYFTIQAGQTVTVTVKHIEFWGETGRRYVYFYAPAPQYTHTIYYNANGGSGSMGATTVTDYNSGNTNVTFASNGFSAPTGHYFAGWRINNTGTVYLPGNSYPVGGNGSVTAYAYWLPNSYTVSLTAGTGGTVSGGGTYNYGSSCTITATPNTNYKFTKWSDDNTSASRTFTVTGNVSLTAYFELDAVQVTGASNGNGSVTGGGQYNIGSTATLTAVPDTHYKFIKWNDDTTTNPKSFTVTQAVTYTATFGWAYPNMPVKVNGNWVDGTPYVKANGSWVQAKKVWINDSGTWKESTLK